MHRTRPPVRHHPQSLPQLPLLRGQALDDVGEGREDGGAVRGHGHDVVEGVGEGRLLETAVYVPARPAHVGAALAPVVGHAEDVSVRRLGVVVERGLDVSEPAADGEVQLWGEVVLLLEDEQPVLGHVPPDEVHGVRAEALRQLDPRHLAAQLDLLEGIGPRQAHPGLSGRWTGGQFNNAKYLLNIL